MALSTSRVAPVSGNERVSVPSRSLVLEDEDLEEWTTVNAISEGDSLIESQPKTQEFSSWTAVSIGLCNAVDAIETTAFGSVLTSYVDPYTQKRLDEDPQLSGMLTSGVFFGMLLGGLIAGKAADVYGRRPVLLASMMMNGISAVLSALCPFFPGREVYWLLGFRILAGVGVGGSVPCAYSLMAEWSPDETRGTNVSHLNATWSIGMIFTALSAWLLLSPEDNTKTWPSFLFVCAMPAFAAFVATMAYVVEAPRDSKQENAANESSSSPSSSILTLLAFSSVWFCQSFGSYGVSTWIGDVFHEIGYKDPFAVAVAFAFATVPGTVIATLIVDRNGRKVLLGGGMVCAGLSAIVFGQLSADSHGLLILSTCLFSVFVTMAWVGLGVMSSEAFPFESRTTRMGIAAAFGRIGSITANSVNPYLLKEHLILTVAGGVLILGSLCGLVLLTDQTGQRLDR